MMMMMMKASVQTHIAKPHSIRAASTAAASSLKKTAVHDSHIALGGTMVDYAGFHMPVLYKSESNAVQGAATIVQSTQWTRDSASLFDVSHMCSLKWTGKDAAAFLERVTVGDISGLAMNKSTLSVITNEQGGVIDDTMITKCEDHIYQVINAGCADKDLAHFDHQLGLFGGDVKMEVNWVDDRGLYALQGPKAASVLQKIIGAQADVARVSFGECFTANIAESPCFITRCGYTGEDGFEIYTALDTAVPVWEALCQEDPVRVAGLGARDILRLEAGLCLYGNELTETITPPEAGLSWTVGKSRRAENAKKFLGSEIILAQLNDRTLIKKLRCGLVMTEKGPPARTGAKIINSDNEEIGVVTSGGASPILKSNIAIGYVNKPFNKKSTNVAVQIRSKTYKAITTPMPFVPTQYYK